MVNKTRDEHFVAFAAFTREYTHNEKFNEYVNKGLVDREAREFTGNKGKSQWYLDYLEWWKDNLDRVGIEQQPFYEKYKEYVAACEKWLEQNKEGVS